MQDNHQRFLKHLKESQDAVWTLARWLVDGGRHVRVNATSFAPSREQWRKHADSGDIEIVQRIEVKHLSAEFTGRHDWPHKDKYIVCAKHVWDNAFPKPHAYVHTNRAMTHAGIVLTETWRTWTVGIRSDSRYDDESQQCYFVPIGLVLWRQLAPGELAET